jgi:8-amino-3,8-dideoxy-alpha-D-manno-octulosonate transaminase
VGGSYKGRTLGSIGTMGVYSHQVNKTISAGEGGSVVTNDALLFERAVRYHDLGGVRPLVASSLEAGPQLEPIAGVNFRMTEWQGGVMLEQVRKLDGILARARASYKRIRAGVADLPGIRFRKDPDPTGSIGDSLYIEFPSSEQRNRFLEAMKAENVPCRPPAGSVILPVQSYIEKKLTAHRNWPTWTVGRGKSVKYGAHSCPRTIEIHNRFGGVSLNPGLSEADCDDVVAAIRKVYPTVSGSG